MRSLTIDGARALYIDYDIQDVLDDYEELAKLKSGAQWTISTAREHLSFQTADPWAGYWGAKQNLTGPMKALSFKPNRATSSVMLAGRSPGNLARHAATVSS